MEEGGGLGFWITEAGPQACAPQSTQQCSLVTTPLDLMNNLSASWGEFLILRTRRNNSSVFAFSSTLNFSSSQMQVHSCLARQEMPQVSRQQKARPEPGPSSQTHLVLAQEGSFGGLCPPQTLEQQLPPRSCGLTLTRQRAKETSSNCNW